MKKWRRSSSSGSSSIQATCHSVVRVDATAGIAIWTFDADVDNADDIGAMFIDGVGAVNLVSYLGPVVTVEYVSPDLEGNPWTIDVGAISFIDGLPLCPGQSGIVI